MFQIPTVLAPDLHWKLLSNFSTGKQKESSIVRYNIYQEQAHAHSRLWAENYFPKVHLYACKYICLAFRTHVSNTLWAKSNLYTRIESCIKYVGETLGNMGVVRKLWNCFSIT